MNDGDYTIEALNDAIQRVYHGIIRKKSVEAAHGATERNGASLLQEKHI